MLKNDIEKTLQAHQPAIPAGFSERSDAQVLELFAEGKKQGSSLKRKLTVLVCGLLLMLTLSTALAATVPGVNNLLYKMWPQAAEALMPVNAGCEDQGIRMDVISAVAKDEQILVTYTMQDLEGDRINESTEARLSTYITVGNSTDPLPGNTYSTLNLDYDAAAKKATFAQSIDYSYPVKMADEVPVTLNVSHLVPYEVTDLSPLLEQYGMTQTTERPGNATFATTDWGTLDEDSLAGMPILDASKGPDLAINDYVHLTGIGWVDGKLHVQTHYPDHQMMEDPLYKNIHYFPAGAEVFVLTPEGYDFADGYGIAKGFAHIQWDDNGDGMPDWDEYIFDCEPEELKQADFRLQFSRKDWIMEGNWNVTVPYRMIKFE